LFGLREVDIHDGDISARTGQPQRDSFTNALSGACDDSNSIS
jgi:hypothetical protein